MINNRTSPNTIQMELLISGFEGGCLYCVSTGFAAAGADAGGTAAVAGDDVASFLRISASSASVNAPPVRRLDTGVVRAVAHAGVDERDSIALVDRVGITRMVNLRKEDE